MQPPTRGNAKQRLTASKALKLNATPCWAPMKRGRQAQRKPAPPAKSSPACTRQWLSLRRVKLTTSRLAWMKLPLRASARKRNSPPSKALTTHSSPARLTWTQLRRCCLGCAKSLLNWKTKPLKRKKELLPALKHGSLASKVSLPSTKKASVRCVTSCRPPAPALTQASTHCSARESSPAKPLTPPPPSS